MTLTGITLPVLVHGIIVASQTADVARHRNEAAALAESELTELVAYGNLEAGTSQSGDFGPDWPDYHWQLTVGDWTQSGLEQVDIHVTWNARGNREVVLSTLYYNGINAGSGASGSTGTSSTGSGSGSGKTGTGSGSSGSKGTGGGK